ncbi:Uncharacterised protein [Oligella urethralis]|nr:Uncharacterised protein [Oligella urethralis]
MKFNKLIKGIAMAGALFAVNYGAAAQDKGW